MNRPLLLALAAAALLASSYPTRAAAQSKKDFSTVRFYPAVGPGNYIGVEGAQVPEHLSRSFGAVFDYSADTLEVERPCEGIRNLAGSCASRETAFLHGTGLLHLMGSIAIKGRTQLSLDLPLGFTDTEPFSTQVVRAGNPTLIVQPRQGFNFGDARLSAKTHIWSTANRELRLGATVFTTLPTGMITSNGNCREPESCSFLGERGVQAGGYAIGEFERGEFRGAVNLGAAYRPNRRFLTLETGTEILYGVAGAYAITPLLTGKAEIVGALSPSASDYPLEARAQIGYGRDLQVNVGAGAGIVGDVGNPLYRVFLGVLWTPTYRDADQDRIEDADDACPRDAEDRDGFMDSDGCPELDNDADGIPDDKDKCDAEREDFDGHEDEDGCPDNDRDGDGVPDGYDSCEGVKEDLDGDRDDDGCPDLDADRDGVSDADDRCPNQAEDTDGLADDDGCPETDFDGDNVPDTDDACPDASETWNDLLDQDGCPEDDEDADSVADQLDQCPDKPETLNGKTDADGCPDGAMLMVLKGQRLLPTATPQFDGSTLRGASFLVEAIADFVKRNHKRGQLHVVLVAPAEDKEAAARAQQLASQLQRRTGREVSSAHVPGSPAHFEIELVPPGLRELPRPKSPVPTPASAPSSGPVPGATSAPIAPPPTPAPAAPAPATPPNERPATPSNTR